MNLQILETADQVFDALGGNAGIEKLTASSQTRVANWRKAGSFPANVHALMTEALRAEGKAAPSSLWRQREPERAA